MDRSSKPNSSSSSSSGIGFAGLLTVAFIVLKLCGVIDWSWGWVLAPLWIPTVLILTVFMLAGLGFILRSSVAEHRRRRAAKRQAAGGNGSRSLAMHGPVRKWGYRPADVERMRLHADQSDRQRLNADREELREDDRRLHGEDRNDS
jgi:hypothetical protein